LQWITSRSNYYFVSAYLYSTLGIGFLSEEFWNKCKHKLSIKGEADHKDDVFCCSKPDHFEDVELKSFINLKTPLELIETDITPDDKPIALIQNVNYTQSNAIDYSPELGMFKYDVIEFLQNTQPIENRSLKKQQ
jgi:hypothetical protein